jgi:hypothetical protein
MPFIDFDIVAVCCFANGLSIFTLSAPAALSIAFEILSDFGKPEP